MSLAVCCHAGRRRRSVAATLLLLFVAALAPAAAHAANAITRFAAGPIGPQTHCDPNITADQYVTTAGARVDFCLAFYQDGNDPATGDDVAAAVVDLPDGFLATADTSPQCTLEQFAPTSTAASSCPAQSQTGSGQALVRVQVAGLLTVTLLVPVTVWNVEHQADAVAGVGLELAPNVGGFALPHTKIVSYTQLRPNPNVGLRTTIDEMPRTTDLGPLGQASIAIDGFFLRFWGSKADHPQLPQSFALLGSDCTTDQVTTFSTTSVSGATQSAQSRLRLTDCAQVPFGIHASVATTERRPDVPTGVQVTVAVDQYSDPRVGSNLRSTQLTLPAGLELGAQVASGDPLEVCTAEQFAWASSAPVQCPAASKISDVEIISPLQANAFRGAGYLGAQPAPGELPQVFLVGEFSGAPNAPRIKLRGQLSVDDQGRLVTTLADLPQVLFERFTLTFRGGDHAPLQTPAQCGTTEGSFVATPSNGNAPVQQPLALTIDADCIDPQAFAPTMALSSTNEQAGGRGVMTVRVDRPDRQARVASMVVDLPQGVLSDLNAATECAAADAQAGSCPASSRIGTLTASSGVGPAPYAVRGDVFLRERQGDDVAGLEIVMPVQFGPVDLGRLSLPARIELRPDDLGLRLRSQVPLRFKGLPLNLRSFEVALDRPGFSINPTSCEPLSSTSALTSAGGVVASVPLSFQVSGCDALAFDPSIAFALGGATGSGGKPSIDVTVSLAPGGSNLRAASVLLPPGLSADLTQLGRACAQADWVAGSCGADAVIGTVQGRLAITDELLDGTLSMVKVEGRALPSIGIRFGGRFASTLLGEIAVDKPTGRLATSFPQLPDVPLKQLALHLAGGASAPLSATAELCAQPPMLAASFTGHSGATATRTATARCSSAQAERTAAITKRGSLRHGIAFTVKAPAGKKLTVLRVGLPAGVRVAPGIRTKRGVLRHATSVRVLSSRTLGRTLAKLGTTRASLKTPKGTFVFSRAVARKKQVTVTVRIGYADGTRETAKLVVWR
ncbi:MAG: hypothetical protein QM679_01375 [Patulibacter sp.]